MRKRREQPLEPLSTYRPITEPGEMPYEQQRPEGEVRRDMRCRTYVRPQPRRR